MRTDAELRTLRADLMDRIRLAERVNIIPGVTEQSTDFRAAVDQAITTFLVDRRAPLRDGVSFNARHAALQRRLVQHLNRAIVTYEHTAGEWLPTLPGDDPAARLIQE